MGVGRCRGFRSELLNRATPAPRTDRSRLTPGRPLTVHRMDGERRCGSWTRLRSTSRSIREGGTSNGFTTGLDTSPRLPGFPGTRSSSRGPGPTAFPTFRKGCSEPTADRHDGKAPQSTRPRRATRQPRGARDSALGLHRPPTAFGPFDPGGPREGGSRSVDERAPHPSGPAAPSVHPRRVHRRPQWLSPSTGGELPPSPVAGHAQNSSGNPLRK